MVPVTAGAKFKMRVHSPGMGEVVPTSTALVGVSVGPDFENPVTSSLVAMETVCPSGSTR